MSLLIYWNIFDWRITSDERYETKKQLCLKDSEVLLKPSHFPGKKLCVLVLDLLRRNQLDQVRTDSWCPKEYIIIYPFRKVPLVIIGDLWGCMLFYNLSFTQIYEILSNSQPVSCDECNRLDSHDLEASNSPRTKFPQGMVRESCPGVVPARGGFLEEQKLGYQNAGKPIYRTTSNWYQLMVSFT